MTYCVSYLLLGPLFSNGGAVFGGSDPEKKSVDSVSLLKVLYIQVKSNIQLIGEYDERKVILDNLLGLNQLILFC